MYGGRIVEEGPTETVLRESRHPYTRGLLAAVPDHLAARRLHGIPGVAVGVTDRPPGCAYAPRCALRVRAVRRGAAAARGRSRPGTPCAASSGDELEAPV